jgi:hypothetical protein
MPAPFCDIPRVSPSVQIRQYIYVTHRLVQGAALREYIAKFRANSEINRFAGIPEVRYA